MLVKDEAQRYAESVRFAHWGASFPVDPFAVAKALSIRVHQENLPPNTSGMIVKNPGVDPEIYIEMADSPPRQRFTVAHEIGHFVERTYLRDLPDDKYSFVERRDGEMTLHEFFANEFAGNLLMPSSEVLRLRAAGYDKVRMAAYFGVSAPAMSLRLQRVA